jgi:hypothetical protein
MRFALTFSSLRGRLIRSKNAAAGVLLFCFEFALSLWFALSTNYCAAQSPLPGTQASPIGGSATGAPHAVLDAEHRLMTAGGFPSVEVYWPSGARERFPVPQVERIINLIEGKGQTF